MGRLTEKYCSRMYGLLDLYALPYREGEPVICIDEKSKQLLKDMRPSLPLKPGVAAKQDYEYQRAGTCNLFVAVEPNGQRRIVEVTARRTKADFVDFVCPMLNAAYARAVKVHLVLDNLNTHFRSSFEEVLGHKAATTLLRRVEFHYTPKHASWLNTAEIEIGILERQYLGRRLKDQATITLGVAAWQQRRNTNRCSIVWSFTRQDADHKLGRHYVS
jgi:hypothetical protein